MFSRPITTTTTGYISWGIRERSTPRRLQIVKLAVQEIPTFEVLA
jgi:hypothetical protein